MKAHLVSKQRSGLKTVHKSDTDSYYVEGIEDGKLDGKKGCFSLIIYPVVWEILFGLLLVDCWGKLGYFHCLWWFMQWKITVNWFKNMESYHSYTLTKNFNKCKQLGVMVGHKSVCRLKNHGYQIPPKLSILLKNWCP